MSHLVQIRGSRPKGNSGRSMKPCLPASGVWNARGWMRKLVQVQKCVQVLKYLTHEVGLEVGCIKASLHLFEALKGDERVEMAVDSHNMSTSLCHPDPALSGGDAVHVALGPDAHGGGHW